MSTDINSPETKQLETPFHDQSILESRLSQISAESLTSLHNPETGRLNNLASVHKDILRRSIRPLIEYFGATNGQVGEVDKVMDNLLDNASNNAEA